MKISKRAVAAFIFTATTSHTLAFSPSVFGASNNLSYLDQHQNVVSSKKPRTLVAHMVKADDRIVLNSDTLTPGFNNGKILSQKDQSASAQILSLDAARTSVKSNLANYKGQTGASIIYSKLVEHGVDVVNGYSGGAVLPLLDQFHQDHPRHEKKEPPIRWITNSNEGSAGYIAEGYAKASFSSTSTKSGSEGKQAAGVVIATSGPGVTNLITPLQDAICDGVPMVVMCGQAATTAPSDAFQQAPAIDLTRPCTKWCYQIKSSAELPFVMDYAFFIARHGRPGPVFIDLPKDLQNQVIDDDLIESFVASMPVKGDQEEEKEGFARFVPRYEGTDIVQEHVMHLGVPDMGILFKVSENDLEQITDVDLGGQEGAFQMDHHPSEMIFKEEGEGESQSRIMGGLAVDSSITEDLLKTIQKARKPIIVAGQGCNDCAEDLKEFAEAMNIPVATTLHALGCFDERHDLALNMLGMHGHPTPNFMIQEADLVLCIGSRFDDRITGRVSDFIPEAKKAADEGRGGIIHVDIRLSENAKQVKPTFFVHSTAKKFLKTMLSQSALNKSEGRADRTEWMSKMSTLQSEFPVKVPNFPTETITGTDEGGNPITATRTRMSAQSVVTELNKQLLEADVMDDCLFSTGVGIHQMVTAQLITWTQPRQMITSGSLGTMGVALGFIIGCKLANKSKICIAVDGDGSFNMTFTELKTVAEQKIPVKILILDNESQMMVEYWQRLFHEERYLAVTNTVNPNYGKLADAFGIKNLYADSEEGLAAVMHEFLFADPDEPVVMHARIEKTPCLPLVAPGKPLQEMILEDTTYEGLDPGAAPS